MSKEKPTQNVRKYFCAANSAVGFYSLFDKTFSPDNLKRIYILKGGPGCGKSTTMKKISAKAKDMGYSVENYYCSSSPDSLDGVIIKELGTAVVDGTAPHIVEPKYPAVCEIYVNLGDAWDIEKANEIDKEIKELAKVKKDAYKKAYAYLYSAKGAQDILSDCTEYCLQSVKLERAVDRFCAKQKIKKNGYGIERLVFTECNSSHGSLHLPTLEETAKNKYFVKDYAGIEKYFFMFLRNELLSRGATLVTSLNPTEPQFSTGIYILDTDTSITTYNEEYARTLDRQQTLYKIINTARFCDSEKLKKQRVVYKYAQKSKKTLMNGAYEQLRVAANAHEDMEKLYHTITDYDKIRKIAENIENEIFS